MTPELPSPLTPASSPLRVLHVITRMVKGGAQENTLATAAGIHGAGWESSLITGPAVGPEGTLEPECLAAGVRTIHLPELVRELSPRQDQAAVRKLVALLRKERPHLVHTHTSKAGILGRLAARHARVPVILHTPHGHVFHSYESRLKTRLFIHAERFCAPMADRLIALTETEMEEHLELGIGRPEQWRVIHSGIDFAPFDAARELRASARASFGIPREATVLATVARLVPIKGHTYLIDAFARLGKEFPNLHLLLAGDGPLREALLRQARERGLHILAHGAVNEPVPPPSRAHPLSAQHPTVHFLGLRRDVPQILAAADLFVLPSLNEGMGRVLVEAMAMELPCVASRVSGIPDVVDHDMTGLLVPSENPEALAKAIRCLLQDPGQAAAMGRRGREKVLPTFGVQRMLEQLERLYREVLLAKGLTPPAPVPAGSGTTSLLPTRERER
jgi:glycosyltransferase involved in cell wall biosynthesis